jgi:hypothetical protein
VPNPMRCFRCQRYGHTKSRCTKAEVCANCGQAQHVDGQPCPSAAHCINCKGDHAASSKKCPQWLEEKQIIQIKEEFGIGYPEARARYTASQSNAQVQNMQYARRCCVATRNCCQETQTDVTWPIDSAEYSMLPTSPALRELVSTTAKYCR